MPYTYYLTDCSQDAIEDCYYRGEVNNIFVKNIESGDTIVLPAGTAEWGDYNRGNNGRIYFILPITVRGQGDSTIITMADNGVTYALGVINLWSAITWADMKVIGAPTRPVTPFHSQTYNNTGGGGINFYTGFRITNVTYQGGGGSSYMLYFAFGVSGLIDNCRISGATGNTELFFGRGSTDAWQSNNTIGTFNNVFIEDCIFSNNGYLTDANANARMVVRFCTVQAAQKVDGHGLASNSMPGSTPRGFRNMEVYHNTWTYSATSNWTAIEMRGGTFMIFNNTAQGAAGWFYLTDYGYLATWPNFGNVFQTPYNYPIRDQVGTGKDIILGAAYITAGLYVQINSVGTTDFLAIGAPSNTAGTTFIATGPTTGTGTVTTAPAAAEPAYIWNNKNNAGGAWTRTLKTVAAGAITQYQTQTGNPSATFDERTMIQANRDFYASAGFDTDTGASVGTKAQMLAFTPAINKYGWWVTDEGTWNKIPGAQQGKLYTWNGSQWNVYYEPYEYPHPLRGFVVSQRKWKRLAKFPKFKVYAE
jgi:hypothetical protein